MYHQNVREDFRFVVTVILLNLSDFQIMQIEGLLQLNHIHILNGVIFNPQFYSS